jgi:hypothetical protein
MNLFVLFGDGAITRKNDGTFASCATRNDAVFRLFFRVILHHRTKNEIHSLNTFLLEFKQICEGTARDLLDLLLSFITFINC